MFKSGGAKRTVAGVSLALAVALGMRVPLGAQDVAEVTVRGVVRDALTGTALAGARLRFEELRQGTLTQDGGGFEFTRLPEGIHVLSVEHYGYTPIEAIIDVGSGGPGTVVLELTPKPVMLDGITVVGERLTLMNQRLRSRRRAYPRATRAFEQERLFRSPARNLLEFLSTETSLAPTACSGRQVGSWCILRRGRATEPAVYIDEARVIGGLDQLATYQPYDLYLVEVYSSGLEIRAYTHSFMERMARQPMHLIPIGVGSP